MIALPHNMTPEQLAGYMYDRTPYKPGKCAESVQDSGRWPRYNQRSRDSGHGAKGLYCKQHAKTYPDLSDTGFVVRYEVSPYSDTISPYDVTEASGFYFTTEGRRIKKADLSDTWEDAHARIIARRESELAAARAAVHHAEVRLAAAHSIQKPAGEVTR